jgi:hypothetical protein
MVMTAVASVALGAGICPRPALAKSAKPAIDPDAMDALHKMGAFLRGQQKFTVRASQTTDDLLASGQKVQFSGTVELNIRRPDRMRMDIRGDRRDQRIYYDGKSFTIFGERVGYYATFQAPPTLAELKDVTEKRYGIDLPLADLFYWGTEHDGTADVTAATKVGVSTVEGAACDHYAFRQKDVDWELWIEQGQHPLPRKLVITTTTEKTRPQSSQVLDWDLAPQLGDDLFTFVPPPESHKIDFETAGHAGSHAQGKEGGTQ